MEPLLNCPFGIYRACSHRASHRHEGRGEVTAKKADDPKRVMLELKEKVAGDDYHHLVASGVPDVNELHFDTDMPYEVRVCAGTTKMLI